MIPVLDKVLGSGQTALEHNQIHFRAEFAIEEGKIEEYKKLVQEMSRVVEANEPDTIDYQFYLNGAETKCIVHGCTCSQCRRCIANNTSKDFQYL